MMNFAKWPMALIAGLLGACQAFAGPPALPSLAPPQPLPVIGSGAWVSQDEWRGLLHIHQLPPAQTVSLRLPGWLAVDLNTTAQVLCGAGADRLMRVSLPDQRGLQAGFSVEPGGPGASGTSYFGTDFEPSDVAIVAPSNVTCPRRRSLPVSLYSKR